VTVDQLGKSIKTNTFTLTFFSWLITRLNLDETVN
jgi:hypothetical protein